MVDLSLHILDVATNGFKAGATLVSLKIKQSLEEIEIWITDNGSGMSEETLKKVTDPFFTSRTTRKVGLGIPLFKQTCEQTGGKFMITSKLNVGTTVYASMKTNHIDAIPLGDLSETIFVLIMNPNECDIVSEIYIKDNEPFILDTREIKQVLDGVPLTENSVALWLKEYIKSGIEF